MNLSNPVSPGVLETVHLSTLTLLSASERLDSYADYLKSGNDQHKDLINPVVDELRRAARTSRHLIFVYQDALCSMLSLSRFLRTRIPPDSPNHPDVTSE